jgi:hypothetical protein
MPEIVTDRYIVRPSNNRDWIHIRSPAGIEVDVELRIMDYHYDCVPQPVQVGETKVPCSRLCCYQGCYITPAEIEFATKNLKKMKPLLTPDAIKHLKAHNDQIYIPEDVDKKENVYKTRCAPNEWTEKELAEEFPGQDAGCAPKNYCVFLMENGLCALHYFCNENKINWVKKKFNICVTFPIDIRPQDMTLGFMDGFDHFTYGNVACISPDEERKIDLKMPQVIDSMKYAIVDRYGEEWWTALAAFAEDYRAGKIDMLIIYPADFQDEGEEEGFDEE